MSTTTPSISASSSSGASSKPKHNERVCALFSALCCLRLWSRSPAIRADRFGESAEQGGLVRESETEAVGRRGRPVLTWSSSSVSSRRPKTVLQTSQSRSSCRTSKHLLGPRCANYCDGALSGSGNVKPKSNDSLTRCHPSHPPLTYHMYRPVASSCQGPNQLPRCQDPSLRAALERTQLTIQMK